MNDAELIPHLFRTEYRKIVSVLSKHFGLDQVEIAEDIASETFLTAAQSWGLQGIPNNPTAWLYLVAKNKAKNYLQRTAHFKNKITPDLQTQAAIAAGAAAAAEAATDIDLSPQNIDDSQLQMMFAICHPSISSEAQIGLSLRILCGFGIDEIAAAFLTNKEAINKRLFRAKERLREQQITIALPPPQEMEQRLAAVLTTIYLLFNEGYYSISQDQTLRKDLCLEAMRLCTMLLANEQTNQPAVNALMALMCFHTSRFDARQTDSGEWILYGQQDASRWNTDLISKGGHFLHLAAIGDTLSKYHLEAGIAFWHTVQQDTKEKWDGILQLYNHLLQLEYSPVAALNRTYALSRVNGKAAAIKEAEKLGLTGNHFYFALLGELYTGIDDKKAKEFFQQALHLAKTIPDQQALQKKIDNL
jgi:RNA polymerase sigma factor (sigma-70 family)